MKLATIGFFVFSLVFAMGNSLQAENMNQSDAEFMRMLQAKAAQARFEDELKNPKKPKINSKRAALGSVKAPLTIVAYSDFQCPYCREGALRVEEIRKKYGEKVRFVFKHLPLSFHQKAMPAAKRFEAINLQSQGAKKAYAFHDLLFKEQARLESDGEAFIDEATKKAGANLAQAKKDSDSSQVQQIIDEDMAEAKSFSIDGTPGFVVGGVTITGAQPMEVFAQVIDQRLASKTN